MPGHDSRYRMLIGGNLVATSDAIAVRNPATGQVAGTAPAAGAAELDQAVTAASAAFAGWSGTPLAQRRAALVAMAGIIEQNVAELAALFTMEQGRPTAAVVPEILGAALWLKATASLDLPVEVTEDSDTRRIEVHRVPLGVVGAIVPWNFPILLAFWKIAPALLAGNTIIVKPSPFTPLTMLRIAELAVGVLPAGVFNVICGDDALGPLMTAHPGIHKISFTGSTPTGRKVMASAAATLKRITLELGGNDPAIVLPDVDVDEVAQKLFFGAFMNTGQVCVAAKRIYAHEDIYDRLRDRMVELARTMPVGDGAQQGTVFGPLQNEPQYRHVKALIAECREQGLAVIEGGPVPEGGYFIPLTLVDNPPETARVVVEEPFGPVLPLMKWRDLDDVVARANDSEYGLAASVWTTNIELATDVAARLDAGTVWINQILDPHPLTPFAGAKQSGMGEENGLGGLKEYTRPKAVFIPR